MDGGKIILNGKTYASNGRPSKEVTMSEWLAMPQSKLTDGIVYYIKDVGGANQYPPLIYSDEEREVGVWRDGRPLYQRVFGLGRIVTLSSDWVKVDNNTTLIPIQCIGISDEYTASYPLIVDSDSDGLYLKGTGVSVSINKFILQYAKTTDTPGSGIWTTQGSYAHHYSTTEHIIGTWIDGKPLYEKCIEIASLPSTAGDTSYPTNTSNISKMWIVGGYCIYSNGEQMLPLNTVRVPDNDRLNGIGCRIVNKNNICFSVGYDRSNFSAIVTINYTKTTD